MIISVVIPVYNVEEALLSRCLKSLMSQNFYDLEVIIVNDGSNETCSAGIANAIKHYSNIQCVSQENAGVSAARNRGTQLAKGQYICYVDADDFVASTYLQDAYSIALKYDADVVMGGNGSTEKAYNEQTENQITVDQYCGEDVRLLRKYMVGSRTVQFGNGVILGQGPWNRLIKAELAKQIRFDENLRIGEDIIWNFELLDKAKTVCVAHALWYLYFQNPVSASRRYRSDAIEESQKSLNEIRKHMDLTNDEEYKSYCTRSISDLKRIYLTFYRFHKGNRKASRVLYEFPWKDAMSCRYFHLCNWKEMVLWGLYRTHLLFFFYRIKDRWIKK